MPTEGLYLYNLNENNEAEIYACNKNASGNIVTPTTLGGYPVVSIRDNAYSGCTGITSITISEGVRSVIESTFENCTGLISISFPASVTEISSDIIWGCTSLITVTIDDDNLNFSTDNKALYNKDKTILYFLFSGLPDTSFTVPSSVITIADSAFISLSNLTEVILPENLNSIGEASFYGCTGITSINIPEGISEIKAFAFFGCSGLEEITIPNSIVNLPDGVFYGCTNLVSVIIPENIVSIGMGAFYECSGLTDIFVYNPEADIYDEVVDGEDNGALTIPSQTVIHGYNPSTAKDYVDKYERTFVEIQNTYSFQYGAGTAEDPYQIWTPEDLNGIRDYLYKWNIEVLPDHYYFKQMADIDLNDFENWVPIGLRCKADPDLYDYGKFTSTYDGNNFKITNLKIHDLEGSHIGLFSDGDGITIKNLFLEDVNITGRQVTGGIIGNTYSNYAPVEDGIRCIIENCHVTGKINGNVCIGGIVGTAHDTNIINCRNDADIGAADDDNSVKGGIAGDAFNSLITMCINTGSVTGESGWYLGGITGYAEDCEEISYCFNTGTISGGDVSFIGGIVGEFEGQSPKLLNCYNSGNIIGGYGVGGLIGEAWGYSSSPVTIRDCFNVGSVNSPAFDGYNAGGGLVGYGEDGIIQNCYNAGELSGDGVQGGLIGEIYNFDVVSCYYDTTVTWHSDNDGRGIPKTTSEMKDVATFAGWDFTDIWGIDPAINDGYPYLKVFVNEEIPTIYQFTYGSGTEQDPYQVWTADDLNGVRDYLDAYFIQMADIDLSEYENWTPIGSLTSEEDIFAGSYDGNGYSVSNLTTSQPMFAGLFGIIWGSCVIKNIAIVDCDITSNVMAGGLVASVGTGVTIRNCMSSGVVTVNTSNEDLDYTPVGGLIGSISPLYDEGIIPSVENCFSTCSVSATNSSETYGVQAGGLIGVVDGQYSTNPPIDRRCSITNCYSMGLVTATSAMYTSKGGLVAEDWDGIYTSCYYDSETSGCSDTDKGTPKTTAEMKQQATFIDWDFTDIWGINPAINDGYPYLKVFVNEEIPTIYQFTYGSGTEADPYQVWTADDLNGVRDYLDAYFIQMADISLSEYNFIPIGYAEEPFSGFYNGNGGFISGLNFENTNYFNSGIFGVCENAVLKNVLITSSKINICESGRIGFLAGSCYSTNIENCAVLLSNIVDEEPDRIDEISTWCGGLIGIVDRSTILNSYTFLCNITGITFAGGLIGGVYDNSNVTNCYALEGFSPTIFVTAENGYQGGLIGYLEDGCSVMGSYYDSSSSDCTDTGKGEPKTIEEMQLRSTYIDWDFDDTWKLSRGVLLGYPYLSIIGEVIGLDIEIPFEYGNGTEEEPYEIWSGEDLNNIRISHLFKSFVTSHFIQKTNIDLSMYENWEPITDFTGLYDGGGYSIQALKTVKNYGGLIDTLSGKGVLKNIAILGCDIKAEVGGALVARIWPSRYDEILIENCMVSGSIMADSEYSSCMIGGMVGQIITPAGSEGVSEEVKITNCFSTCKVTVNSITGSYIYAAGLIGHLQFNDRVKLTVEKSYAIGEISLVDSPNGYKAGFLTQGYQYTPENININSCYYDLDTTGCIDDTYTGGIGKNTIEMKTEDTFLDWDFTDIWGINPAINNGYPYLKVFQQETETPNNVVIFHDDCSSLDNWTICTDEGHVHYGELFADGDCIYITQENINNNYYDSRQDFYQDCLIGLQDFILEAQIKYEYSKPQREQVASITLYNTENSWERIGFTICPNIDYSGTKGSLYCTNAGSFTFSQNLNYTDDILTYKLCRTGNVLDLYINDIKRGTYENSEIGLVNISGININLGKSRLTDESSLKIPAIYDLKVFQQETDGEEALYVFANGAGTELDPYQVWTADDLNGVRDHLDAYFIQMADIDLSGYANWDPIGEATTGTGHFSGHYDGNGFAVSNLTMSYSDFRAVGLFGSLFNGSIKNLGVENVNINCSGAVFCAGGLVGTASSDNKSLYNITNCYSEGTVISTKCVGLLVGSNGAPVIKCWSEGSVRAETYQYADAGGLVGHQSSHSIENSCSYANVEGVIAGGLLGTSYSGAEVINSYSGGTVRGSGMSGGLVGYSYSIYVTNCYSKCSVELIPANPSSIGGLLGYDDSTTIIYSYYDSTVSGQSDTGKGVPKTTAEMKQQATFVGWDFDTVWGIDPTINDGYPYLQWQSFDSPYAFANGAGTEADPYQVWTADDLNGVRDYPSSHFIQMKHIDLSGYPDWVPIGTATFEGEEVDSNTVFSGFYNGNGYKISNLNVLTGVTMGGGFAGGLFGLAADLALINSGEPSENPPEIKNIILENVNINGGEGLLYAGGLVAYSYGIIISNCSVSGSINGYYGAGGLVGFGMVTVDNSFSSCSVVSPSGIAGSILGEGSGTVNNCYSNGTASCLYTEATGAITMAYGCQIVSSYYDSDIAGISAEFDPDYPGYHIATAKTTAEMKQQETFVGWDFDTVWGIDPAINDGYPYLQITKTDESPSYTLTLIASPSEGGSVTGAGTYNADDYTVTIEAIPADGYLFKGWYFEGEFVSEVNPIVFDEGLQADMELIALFRQIYNYEYGDGTEANPYQVNTKEDLDAVRDNLTAYFIQMADIDLSGVEWDPINGNDTSFEGNYNGNGYKITNITSALFGSTKFATLKNIGLENVNITDSNGALANAILSGTIEDCYSTGTISCTGSHLGGLIGHIQGFTLDFITEIPPVIKNCYSTCTVTSTGENIDGGDQGIGIGGLFGVLGYTFGYGQIENCYSCGQVSKTSADVNINLGGLIGFIKNSRGTITNCFYDSTASGQSDQGKGEPKTTSQMKLESTYVGWDFDTIWGINKLVNNGYPFLKANISSDIAEERYFFVRSRLPITFPAIVPSSYPVLIEKHSPAAIDRPLRQESNETIFPAIEMTAGLTQVELVNKTDQAIIKPGADLSINITDANYGSRSEQINIDPSIELSIDIFDISTSKFEEQETINPSLEINISYTTIQE